jgi:hypothetical protein
LVRPRYLGVVRQIVMDKYAHLWCSTPMSYVTREIAKCDECGFEWLPKGDKPKRCASQKCRTRNWDWKNSEAGIKEREKRAPKVEEITPPDDTEALSDDDYESLTSPTPEPEADAPAPSVAMCGHRIPRNDLAEWWKCNLPAHDLRKVQHNYVREGSFYDTTGS